MVRARRTVRGVAGAAALAVAAAGLVAGGWSTAAAGATALVPLTARVLDAGGAGVASCNVRVDGEVTAAGTLRAKAGGYTSTRQDGTFSVSVVPGAYEVSLSCFSNGMQVRRLDATVGATGTDLGDVVLAPTVPVSGVVRGPDGSGLTQATVSFASRDGSVSGSSTWTGFQGGFGTALVPGDYDVTYSPPYGADMQRVSVPLTVGPEGVSGIEVDLPVGVVVSGVVTENGTPRGGVYVSATSAGGDMFGAGQTTAPDGSFSIAGLTPGAYTVTAYGDDGRLQGTQSVSAPASAVAVAVQRQGTLSGRALATTGERLPGYLSVQAQAGDGDSNGDYSPGPTFTIERLRPGTPHVVGVNRQSGQSLYTGRFYAGNGLLGAARSADAVSVTPTAAGTDIGTTLLDTCATVSGRVADLAAYRAALPFPDARLLVAVFNDDDPDLVTRTAPVADDGTYTVTGLLPGDYYVALNLLWSDYSANGVGTYLVGDDFFAGADPADGDAPSLSLTSCAPVAGVNFGTAPVTAAPTDVVATTPVRLVDAPAVTGFGEARCAVVAGAGAPAGASGVLVNVASVSPRTAGNVVLFPDDGTPSPTPPAAGVSVNFEPGRDVANAAFVKIGANGRICWYAQSAEASRVVVDVVGFTMPDSGVTLASSTRLLDTRPGADHVGDIASALVQRQVYEVTAAGRAGVPADAKAVVLNIAVVNPAGPGHLRVYPADGASTAPDIASVNYAPGTAKSNAAVVPIGVGGKIGLYSDTLSGVPTNVVLDVTGYVAADGETYRTVTPERVLDTRASAPAGLRPFGTLAANQVYALDVRGTDVVPDDATGVVLNVTAIKPSTMGNLRVYPDSDGTGQTSPPSASSINYIVGRDIPNLVVVGIPANGKIALYSNQGAGGTVDVAVDVVGYVTAGGVN